MKKAQLTGFMLSMIVLASFLVFSLVYIAPALIDVISGKAESGKCAESILISAGLGAIPLSEKIPVECKAEYITVTKRDIDDRRKQARKAIGTYQKDPTHPLNQWFSPRNEAEWVLNSIMAKQLTKGTEREQPNRDLEQSVNPKRVNEMICAPSDPIAAEGKTRHVRGQHRCDRLRFDPAGLEQSPLLAGLLRCCQLRWHAPAHGPRRQILQAVSARDSAGCVHCHAQPPGS